jgi:hypothetical protein
MPAIGFLTRRKPDSTLFFRTPAYAVETGDGKLPP